VVTLLLADVPVEIGRDDARAAVRAELSDPRYSDARPGLLSRALQWVLDRISDLFDAVSGAFPGGFLGLLVLLLVLVAIFVVVRLRVGRMRGSAAQPRRVFVDRTRTAAEHRAASEAAANAGDFGEAVRERFRGVVRALEQRGLLDTRSGRTADEAAADAGRLLPDCAEALRDGARLFDDVHYGGHAATPEGYRRLVELDERCAAARPLALGAS
jgi:hypothetical protein